MKTVAPFVSAVSLLAILNHTVGAPPMLAQVQSLTGEWVYEDGSEAGEATRVDAIEQATSELGRFARRRARGRLRDQTAPVTRLVIQDEGARVTIATDNQTQTLTVDGAPTVVQGEQGAATVHASRRDGALVVVAEGENGGRTTHYKLSDDGSQLTLEIEVTSTRLSSSIDYGLTYARR